MAIERTADRVQVCALRVVLLLAANMIGDMSSAWAEEASGSFRFQDVSSTSLGLWEGERPVLVYNHGLIKRDDVRGGRPRATYIHPLYGLGGEVLTDDFPADHTYHRGVYWAWPHVKIGDQEFDQWSLRSLPSDSRSGSESGRVADRASPTKGLCTARTASAFWLGPSAAMPAATPADASSPNFQCLRATPNLMPLENPIPS